MEKMISNEAANHNTNHWFKKSLLQSG